MVFPCSNLTVFPSPFLLARTILEIPRDAFAFSHTCPLMAGSAHDALARAQAGFWANEGGVLAYLEVHMTNLSWKKVAVHCLGFVLAYPANLF